VSGQGSYYELETVKALVVDGYWVCKAAGSKGVADLVALKPGEVLLLQVKKGRAFGGTTTNRITHEEWNGLYALARHVGALPIVADFPTRRELADAALGLGRVNLSPRAGQKWGDRVLRFHRIAAAHRERSKAWAAEPFTLDRVGAPQ
jgi:Holliday junction resolvase